MFNSSIPDSRYDEVIWSKTMPVISKAPFPIYIPNEASHFSLVMFVYNYNDKKGYATSITLKYSRLLSDDVEPQTLGITSKESNEPLDYPIWVDVPFPESLGRVAEDYTRSFFPEIDLAELPWKFGELIDKTAETEEYQTASSLRFFVSHVDKPFPLHSAYADSNFARSRVYVGGAGWSRTEFLGMLDSLVPVRGDDDVLLRQLKKYILKR